MTPSVDNEPINHTRNYRSDLFAAIVSPAVLLLTTWLAISTEAKHATHTATFVIERLAQDVGPFMGTSIVIYVAAIAAMSIFRKELLPRVAAASVLGCLPLLIALHVLEPGNRPFDYVMSTYALTDHGYLVGPAVLLASGAKLAIGHHLFAQRQTIVSFLALLFLACSAAGGILGAAFPLDPTFPPETIAGRLHLTGGLIMALPFDVVSVIFTFLMGKATFGRMLWPLFVIGLVGFLLGMAVVPLLETGISGFVQRISVACSLLWIVIAAFVTQPALRS